MMRFIACFALSSLLLATAGVSAGFAQVDLVVQKTDISVVKDNPTNTTYVTVTVHNNGSVVSGPFTLRIGVSKAGSQSTTDVLVPGIAAGLSTSRMTSFVGTDWMCAWGNADIGHTVAESSETNNVAS
jgi:hypothetical protein